LVGEPTGVFDNIVAPLIISRFAWPVGSENQPRGVLEPMNRFLKICLPCFQTVFQDVLVRVHALGEARWNIRGDAGPHQGLDGLKTAAMLHVVASSPNFPLANEPIMSFSDNRKAWPNVNC
jgi:hypothetical protein